MATQVVNIIVKAKDEASGVFSDIGKSIGSKGGLAGALGKVGGVAAGAVVAGVGAAAAGMTAFTVKGISKAADLEAQMAGIAAVMGKTTKEVAPLNDLILDLGIDPTLKVSTFEAADAIELLARNGLDMTKIMDGAAKSTVQLANATGADFGDAADVATDVMSLFNIQAGDMGAAVDGITSVVTNSKFGFDDFRLALAQGGGVAAAVGVDFKDFNTTIAGIAPLFASGSDAGTSFKTFLQRLVPSTNNAIAAMADLGIIAEDGSNRFFDAAGNMKPMAEIAGILAQATAGLSEEQKNQAFSTIFGADAMRAAFGVAQLGEEGFRSLQAAMSDTSGADAAATRMDGLGGTMEIVGGIIEGLQVGLGQKLLPQLNQMATSLADFLGKEGSGFVDMLADMAIGVLAFAERALPIFFDFVRSLKETLGPALMVINDAWTRMGKALGITNDEVSTSDVLLSALKGILDAVVIGVQALAIAFQGAAWVVETFQKISKAVTPIMDLLTIGFDDIAWAADLVSKAIKGVTGWFDSLGDKIANLDIPDWLKPGSPPPLALALADISKQLSAMPDLSLSMGASLGGGIPLGATPTGGSTTINVSIDGVSVSSTTGSKSPDEEALMMTVELLRKVLQLRA